MSVVGCGWGGCSVSCVNPPHCGVWLWALYRILARKDAILQSEGRRGRTVEAGAEESATGRSAAGAEGAELVSHRAAESQNCRAARRPTLLQLVQRAGAAVREQVRVLRHRGLAPSAQHQEGQLRVSLTEHGANARLASYTNRPGCREATASAVTAAITSTNGGHSPRTAPRHTRRAARAAPQ